MNKYVLSFALFLLGLTFSAHAMDRGSSSSSSNPSPAVAKLISMRVPAYGSCGQNFNGCFFHKMVLREETGIWIAYFKGGNVAKLCISGKSRGQCFMRQNCYNSNGKVCTVKEMLSGLRSFFYEHNKFQVDPEIEDLEAAVLREIGLESLLDPK